MTPRKRNMLEAFQAGRDLPGPISADRPSAGTRQHAAGPLAEGPGDLASAGAGAARPALEVRSDAGPPRARGDALPVLVPAALVVLLLGFWLGRLSTGWWGGGPAPASGDLAFETRVADGAREPGREAAPAPPDPGRAAAAQAPGATVSPEGYTADDLAFLDKRNRITLRAIYYDATPAGRRKALESYQHLRAHGLPAVAPLEVGDLVLICVGAAPRLNDPELERLRQRLLTLEGPPPLSEPTPYATAFQINIDAVVVRD